MKFRYAVKNVQADKLYELAKESTGLIVEIGSCVGKSTIAMALGSLAGGKFPVYAIDPWKNPLHEKEFIDNIHSAKVSHLVRMVKAFSMGAWQMYQNGTIPTFEEGFSLLFIDGAHAYKSVKEDLQWVSLVKKGGMIAFHDYKEKLCPGVAKAIDEYLSSDKVEMTIVDIVDTLLVCRKT